MEATECMRQIRKAIKAFDEGKVDKDDLLLKVFLIADQEMIVS